jgi:hypothetical protein
MESVMSRTTFLMSIINIIPAVMVWDHMQQDTLGANGVINVSLDQTRAMRTTDAMTGADMSFTKSEMAARLPTIDSCACNIFRQLRQKEAMRYDDESHLASDNPRRVFS